MNVTLDKVEAKQVVNALKKSGNDFLANRISALMLKAESRKIASESKGKPVSFPSMTIGYGGTTKSIKESDYEI